MTTGELLTCSRSWESYQVSIKWLPMGNIVNAESWMAKFISTLRKLPNKRYAIIWCRFFCACILVWLKIHISNHVSSIGSSTWSIAFWIVSQGKWLPRSPDFYLFRFSSFLCQYERHCFHGHIQYLQELVSMKSNGKMILNFSSEFPFLLKKMHQETCEKLILGRDQG